MDGAKGDGGDSFLSVAEGGGHGGATHGHGTKARPKPDILQKSYEKFVEVVPGNQLFFSSNLHATPSSF